MRCAATALCRKSRRANRASRLQLSDPDLLRRYWLYRRVKAALALSPGPERVAALHPAKIDDDKKH